MKKSIWLAAGVAGMLLGNPHTDANAEVNIRIGDLLHLKTGNNRPAPAFVVNTRPTFVYLQGQGFSVSVGSPYDMIYYDDMYYIYHNGLWYSSSYYRGPWVIIREQRLPRPIRRHRWDDIRRFRDNEYRRHDHRYWEEQSRRNDRGRRDQPDHRGPQDRRDQPDYRGPQDRRDQPDQRGPQDRRDQPDQRGPQDRKDQPDQRAPQDRRNQPDQRGPQDRRDQSR